MRLSLTQVMSDKKRLWQSLVPKHDLLDCSIEDAAAWPFGEAIPNIEYVVMSDTTKAGRFGFHDVVDTEEILLRKMQDFQKMLFIPAP